MVERAKRGCARCTNQGLDQPKHTSASSGKLVVECNLDFSSMCPRVPATPPSVQDHDISLDLPSPCKSIPATLTQLTASGRDGSTWDGIIVPEQLDGGVNLATLLAYLLPYILHDLGESERQPCLPTLPWCYVSHQYMGVARGYRGPKQSLACIWLLARARLGQRPRNALPDAQDVSKLLHT